MGKFTNGPDWTDVATMMNALCTLHECVIDCGVTAGSQGHNGSLDIRLIASFTLLPNSGQVRTVVVDLTWPNKQNLEVAATVFKGLYKLDFAISEVYMQRFLPTV